MLTILSAPLIPEGREAVRVGVLCRVDQHLGRGQSVRLVHDHEPGAPEECAPCRGWNPSCVSHEWARESVSRWANVCVMYMEILTLMERKKSSGSARGRGRRPEPNRSHEPIGGSHVPIVDGANWATPANRAAQDRRFLVESTKTGATAGRRALNSGEDEGGREFAGDRAVHERGNRSRPAQGPDTTATVRARKRGSRPRRNLLPPRAISPGFRCPNPRGSRPPMRAASRMMRRVLPHAGRRPERRGMGIDHAHQPGEGTLTR